MIKQRLSKLSKNQQKFIDNLTDYANLQKTLPEDERNIFPISTEPQLVVDCLADLLLGEDWYTVDPLTTGQVNTLILDEILYKYSKEYRKICRRNKKMSDNKQMIFEHIEKARGPIGILVEDIIRKVVLSSDPDTTIGTKQQKSIELKEE